MAEKKSKGKAPETVATARLRYLRKSAQKARLVTALIKGKGVEEALGILKFTKKGVSRDLERLLRSAMANAAQKDIKDKDVDRLYVSNVYVDGGPSYKRTRPAPMGRAYRVVKRLCHITLHLAEKA
jgi:large subunit ribosomal protein L22